MTRRSILEYAEAVRWRYFRASKKRKTEMLNEFVATTRLPPLQRELQGEPQGSHTTAQPAKQTGRAEEVWAPTPIRSGSDGGTKGGLGSYRLLVLQTFAPLSARVCRHFEEKGRA